MRELNLTPARTEKVKRDVERVKKHAIGFLKIRRDNCVELVANKGKIRLGVIGVVGPSQRFGQNFDEVLLCEIGVGSTRPYNKALGLKRVDSENSIPKRSKLFSLSWHQYQLVAPLLFALIKKIAYERVVLWKTGPFSNDPFWVPSKWHFWSGRERTFHSRFSWAIVTRGARFSVAREDEFFIRDIYWAERNLSEVVIRQVEGLAGFISKRINWYSHKYKHRKPFFELKGVKQVKRIVEDSSLPRHLLIEAVRLLRDDKKKRSRFFHYVADMINWNGEETEERKLALQAYSYSKKSNPRSRLKEIQLRATTGLDAKKDYIVFEVYPQKKQAPLKF